MTTAYSVPDTLPKDTGGAKFGAMIDSNASTAAFALLRGIGTSSVNSMLVAHQAVATHTQGSRVEAGHPGMLLAGRTGAPPAVAGDASAQFIRASSGGYLAVYTHEQGSKIEAGHPGMLLVGRTGAPPAISGDASAQFIKASSGGHLAMYTHGQGSPIQNQDIGVLLMGHVGYPSAVNNQTAQYLQVLPGGSSVGGALITAGKNMEMFATGSTAASADTNHSVWGTYNGLSTLSSNIQIHIQCRASGAALRLWQNVNTLGRGFRMPEDMDYYTDLPQMTRNTASQIHFQNEAAGDNAVIDWVVWI